ncbi:DUF3892 domain-containing protein [Agrobacterium sp. NPDC089420]|uniref:DUF3892 domain-containing protein n=1 Tax=Agrobacterium sp. NPDC089420 TaxID=3363918 RepID=UPI0038508F38
MGTFQVTCHTPDNSDPDRRLQGLGGPDGNGWYRSIDTLISLIKQGEKFWSVDQKGNSVWIIVANRNGREYLRTESDGIEPNNLLALPVCQKG